MQWLRGRASDSRLREPRFESCAAVLKPLARLFTLHCSSSFSCINEYLAIDSGGYVCEQPSRINCSRLYSSGGGICCNSDLCWYFSEGGICYNNDGTEAKMHVSLVR